MVKKISSLTFSTNCRGEKASTIKEEEEEEGEGEEVEGKKK